MVQSERTSDADAAFYASNGYVVVRDLIDAPTIEAVLAEGIAVCRGERGPVAGLAAIGLDDETDETVLGRYVTCTHVHKASPMLTSFMADDRIADVVVRLIGENVKAFASQFFIKHAGMPGNAWHQDEKFVPTRDRSLCTAWIALDEATEENGCLRMIPGSHASACSPTSASTLDGSRSRTPRPPRHGRRRRSCDLRERWPRRGADPL